MPSFVSMLRARDQLPEGVVPSPEKSKPDTPADCLGKAEEKVEKHADYLSTTGPHTLPHKNFHDETSGKQAG